jgi:perosamine synthetase
VKSRIHYTKPSITELEVRYATDAAANGWGDKCYEYISRFEEAFKAHLGVKYAIATSSCTGSLHMGLAALGIGPGDEVILADTNWIASAAPITYLGAQPVFVDILSDTWCINPELAEAAITPRTKAIMAVHLYGNLCEMDQLLTIGEKHGIPVIEDAAEAIGSIYHGARAGSIGKFGTFSFHGTKTLTTGEGGMFVTNDPELYERVLTLSNHGRARGQTKQFWPDMVGLKYKMSNIQAAVGCAQLERIDELIGRKRKIFQYYQEHLGHLPGLSMNPEHDGTANGYWMPNVVFDLETGICREDIQAAFGDQQIDARVFFWPLSSLPFLTKEDCNNTNSQSIPGRAINLPSYHDLTDGELDRVIAVVKQLVGQFRFQKISASDVALTSRIQDEIPIRDGRGIVIGRLKRITTHDATSTTLIAALTAWRNRNQRFFLTQFQATESRTANWLRDSVVSDSSRAMYLIQDTSNVDVGHLGVIKLNSDAPELDNMIRGLSAGHPQIMYWAEIALVNSLFSTSNATEICGHVLSNNWLTISLHRSIGFEIKERLRVFKKHTDSETYYALDSDGSGSGDLQEFGCFRITLTRTSFYQFLIQNATWGSQA